MNPFEQTPIDALLASSLAECAVEPLNVGCQPLDIERDFERDFETAPESAAESTAVPVGLGARPLDLTNPNFDFRRVGHSDVLLSSGDEVFETLTARRAA